MVLTVITKLSILSTLLGAVIFPLSSVVFGMVSVYRIVDDLWMYTVDAINKTKVNNSIYDEYLKTDCNTFDKFIMQKNNIQFNTFLYTFYFVIIFVVIKYAWKKIRLFVFGIFLYWIKFYYIAKITLLNLEMNVVLTRCNIIKHCYLLHVTDDKIFKLFLKGLLFYLEPLHYLKGISGVLSNDSYCNSLYSQLLELQYPNFLYLLRRSLLTVDMLILSLCCFLFYLFEKYIYNYNKHQKPNA